MGLGAGFATVDRSRRVKQTILLRLPVTEVTIRFIGSVEGVQPFEAQK